MLLEGLHIPLTTPFFPDGRLALHKLAANVVRYSKSPAAGLIVLGPSGEPTLLSDNETREVLRTVAEAATPEKVLIAGISRDSVHATLALANFTAEQHYDAVLVGVPSILATEFQLSFSMTNDLRHQMEARGREQLMFFQMVADESPLPVILLNEDDRVVELQETIELASHPNIIGILGTGRSHTMQRARISRLLKRTANVRCDVTVTSTFAAVTNRMQTAASASGLLPVASLNSTSIVIVDQPQAGLTLRTRTKTVGFQTLAARTGILLDAINTGAVGIAPAFAACAPQAAYEIYAAWKDSDQPLAEEKQARIRAAAHLVEASPATLKHACDLNGYFGGQPRLPHLPLTGEQRTAIEQIMQPLRN